MSAVPTSTLGQVTDYFDCGILWFSLGLTTKLRFGATVLARRDSFHIWKMWKETLLAKTACAVLSEILGEPWHKPRNTATECYHVLISVLVNQVEYNKCSHQGASSVNFHSIYALCVLKITSLKPFWAEILHLNFSTTCMQNANNTGTKQGSFIKQTIFWGEKKPGECAACLKYSVCIFVE